MELTVGQAELGITFREAKVDLYYSTNPSLFAISDYETNLEESCQRLRKKINGRSTTWVKDSDFLGTWTLTPKAIKCAEEKDASLIDASPEDVRLNNHTVEGQWIPVNTGTHNNCTTGAIDISALGQFQSCHRSPNEDFKPVPDGFAADMSKDRKVLPKGGAK